MKNLITKNVIQRFKQGQKILRFQGGGLTYHGQKVRPVYDNSVGSRDMYYIPGIEQKISRAQLDKGLTEKNSFTSGRQYFRGADGNLYNDKGQKITIKSKPVSLIGKKTDISKARGYKTRSGETNYAVRIGGKWYYTNNKGVIQNEMPNNYISADGQFNFNNGKFSWNIPEKEETNPKTPLRTPVRDSNRYISTLGDIDAYKNSLATEGLADRDAVKAFQEKLGVVADGIWGKNTEAAYQAMLAKNKEPIPTLTQPIQQYVPSLGYRTNFDYTGSNSNIRDLGFNDYTTMVNFINNNPDNQFSRDMIQRFGNTNTWDQNNVESALNVSGKYRSGRGGDFSDIMKSQAAWAGTQNGTYDRNQNFWNNLKVINGRLLFKQGGLISKNPVKRFKTKVK